MYQFVHVESYSRSAPKSAEHKNAKTGRVSGKSGRSVKWIIDEARREPESCPHVDTPLPPLLLHGDPLESLEAACEEWAASVTDALGRKLRKDGLCLLAGVISAPNEIDTTAWEAFKTGSIDWLKEKYGGCLKTVIEHVDESHPHLHFYVIPEHGQRFETVHEGRAASAQAKQEGLKKGGQNQAYKSAMRAFQDDFYEKVGIEHGFARIGPGKRRLTREEWRQEQTQAAATAKAIELATEKVRESEKEAEMIISAADAGADSITRSALEDAEGVKASAVYDRDRVIEDAKTEALALANKTLARVDEIERKAEQAGIEKGMDLVEQMPWFQRVARVIVRAIRQRDELKKTVDQLTTERDDLEKKSKSLAARLCT